MWCLYSERGSPQYVGGKGVSYIRINWKFAGQTKNNFFFFLQYLCPQLYAKLLLKHELNNRTTHTLIYTIKRHADRFYFGYSLVSEQVCVYVWWVMLWTSTSVKQSVAWSNVVQNCRVAQSGQWWPPSLHLNAKHDEHGSVLLFVILLTSTPETPHHECVWARKSESECERYERVKQMDAMTHSAWANVTFFYHLPDWSTQIHQAKYVACPKSKIDTDSSVLTVTAIASFTRRVIFENNRSPLAIRVCF